MGQTAKPLRTVRHEKKEKCPETAKGRSGAKKKGRDDWAVAQRVLGERRKK